MNISVQNVSYAYEDAVDNALEGITAAFPQGWTGIVGDNGAGKSTLLKLLCGIFEPTEGRIVPKPSGEYCAQSTEDIPETIEEFAYNYSPRTIALRKSLVIEDDWLWRYDTLSHGEKKRVQIACALQNDPIVLALDEPTNHLDAATREIIRKTLASFSGVGLLVSHDRGLLDDLVKQCLFINASHSTLIAGTYTAAKEQLDIMHNTAAAERIQAKHELSRISHEAQRRKEVADKSAKRRSARNVAKHDSDARAKIRLAIYTGQDGKTGLLSTQMDKKVEAATKRVEQARIHKRYDKALEIDTSPLKRNCIAHLDAGLLALGEERKLYYPEMFIGTSDRIGFVGSNGAGKSTFLNFVLTHIEDREGMIYIPQELSREDTSHVLDQLSHMASADLGRVLSIVARLNSRPDRILSGNDISPGELRKILLAFGLVKQTHLIAMDEPTNHLDLHSIEALQDVLAQCECALLLVSHDRQFIEALTDIRWDFIVCDGDHKQKKEGRRHIDEHHTKKGDTELHIRHR